MELTACGSCGKTSGCGCKQPETASFDALWHNPLEYDAIQHGPSFFGPRVKLSSDQRREVKAFVKTQATVPSAGEIQRFLQAVEGSPQVALLGILRASASLHQTHHWMCKGSSFFGDHLLFQRLYEESLPGIDAWAERCVGQGLTFRLQTLSQWDHLVDTLAYPMGTGDKVTASITAEILVQSALKLVRDAEGVSPGTANLLDGLADTHETFVYLLSQRREDVSNIVDHYSAG